FDIEEYAKCLEKVIELDGPRGEYSRKAKAKLDELSSDLMKSSGLALDQFLENKHRFDRAVDMLCHGRSKEAVVGFTRVLELDPTHVQSYGILGLPMRGWAIVIMPSSIFVKQSNWTHSTSRRFST